MLACLLVLDNIIYLLIYLRALNLGNCLVRNFISALTSGRIHKGKIFPRVNCQNSCPGMKTRGYYT